MQAQAYSTRRSLSCLFTLCSAVGKPFSRRAGGINFSKRAKECCDFPSLTVHPRISDTDPENASPTEEKTVAEVAGEMCNDFEEWAKESKLRDIPDDFGWNEMSAFAFQQ